MTAEMQLIRLVHQADWTRLSLAAEVNDGSRLLLAPGRRYRVQTLDGAYGCDGERPWRLPKPDEDRSAHWIEGPRPPLPMLLCPAWLLRNSRLDVRGHVTACGRVALHVVATERSSFTDPLRVNRLRPGRTEALVDAELGILLRVAWLPPEDEPPEVTELVNLELDPVTDPSQFAPPPGSVVAESWGRPPAPPVRSPQPPRPRRAWPRAGSAWRSNTGLVAGPRPAPGTRKQRCRRMIRRPRYRRTDGRPGPRSATRYCSSCTTAVPPPSTPRCTSGLTAPRCWPRCRNRHARRASAGSGCSSTR